MVEKKTSAEAAREQNLETAKATFKAGLDRAEAERKRLVEAAEQAGERPHCVNFPHNVDNAFLTVSLQPFYPKRSLVEPWDIKASANELQIQSRHGMSMPPLDMEPTPNGLFSLKVSSFSGIRCYQLYGNGLIYYTEDVWLEHFQAGEKNIHLTHIAFAFYRQLVFAHKFYSKFNYSGLVVGEIELTNAIDAKVHVIVPEGYMDWHDWHPHKQAK